MNTRDDVKAPEVMTDKPQRSPSSPSHKGRLSEALRQEAPSLVHRSWNQSQTRALRSLARGQINPAHHRLIKVDAFKLQVITQQSNTRGVVWLDLCIQESADRSVDCPRGSILERDVESSRNRPNRMRAEVPDHNIDRRAEASLGDLCEPHSQSDRYPVTASDAPNEHLPPESGRCDDCGVCSHDDWDTHPLNLGAPGRTGAAPSKLSGSPGRPALGSCLAGDDRTATACQHSLRPRFHNESMSAPVDAFRARSVKATSPRV